MNEFFQDVDQDVMIENEEVKILTDDEVHVPSIAGLLSPCSKAC